MKKELKVQLSLTKSEFKIICLMDILGELVIWKKIINIKCDGDYTKYSNYYYVIYDSYNGDSVYCIVIDLVAKDEELYPVLKIENPDVLFTKFEINEKVTCEELEKYIDCEKRKLKMLEID